MKAARDNFSRLYPFGDAFYSLHEDISGAGARRYDAQQRFVEQSGVPDAVKGFRDFRAETRGVSYQFFWQGD
jgi:hypothetical protein